MSTLRCAGVAFVVDRERAPLAPVRAVVDERDERRRDELADAVREHRRVLVDEIGLEPVAARLVEQHAARAALQHDRELARRRGHGSSIVSARCRGCRATSSGSISSKSSKPMRAARRLVARLHPGVADRDALHPEARAHRSSSARRPSELATRMRRRASA